MSFVSVTNHEITLEMLGKELQGFIANKDYAAAKKTFQAMKGLTNGCKIRLVGIMLKTGTGAVGMMQRRQMEERAAKAIEIVLKQEEATARAGTLAKYLGNDVIKKGITRFLGPLGVTLLVKDLIDGGLVVAGSMGERMALSRMAQYGDYLERTERSSEIASTKTYNQWLATDYLPGQHQKDSEFWQHLKVIFPQGTSA